MSSFSLQDYLRGAHSRSLGDVDGALTRETMATKWRNVRLVILASIFNSVLCLGANEK